MTKLRLGPIADDRPIRVTVELPAAVHRDLVEYARLLAHESGRAEIAPAKLILPMLTRFMETDRGYQKQRARARSNDEPSPDPV
ncbi:DUF2274 domain-containing protein [Asaia siamensis]|uniref:DUF2274 domain-containing protein n=1 Tax=Asaia siamensis TaxID=110479 RepID=A0ABQ1LZI8_9PROT|nr:DUF2274 domain-containing protein [Asaia siamensis]GBR02671.1 hypothetical protein AA0323_0049 [Asaia siamensis NRIC 0323]GGC31233.1 hypothetical protein GCM10007207_15930 [Asaia siamensis]